MRCTSKKGDDNFKMAECRNMSYPQIPIYRKPPACPDWRDHKDNFFPDVQIYWPSLYKRGESWTFQSQQVSWRTWFASRLPLSNFRDEIRSAILRIDTSPARVQWRTHPVVQCRSVVYASLVIPINLSARWDGGKEKKGYPILKIAPPCSTIRFIKVNDPVPPYAPPWTLEGCENGVMAATCKTYQILTEIWERNRPVNSHRSFPAGFQGVGSWGNINEFCCVFPRGIS